MKLPVHVQQINFAEFGLYCSWDWERIASDEILSVAVKVWKRDPLVRKASVNKLSQIPDVNKKRGQRGSGNAEITEYKH